VFLTTLAGVKISPELLSRYLENVLRKERGAFSAILAEIFIRKWYFTVLLK